ncbi:glycoside hydrolase [Mycena albidolilacea]|uniref:Beta-mannosidase B n=1 Tax=Mycena albidolilacea TaxID=1033008 RepID=A0AAD7ENZ5_9AGAR|nr:glycoside hydrolase [Mycena albidolilacea]
MSRIRNLELSSNWSWKQRETSVESVLDEAGADGWKTAQAYPSEIHVELLKAGLIPDPYLGFNENKVQWIGKVEWMYKCTFEYTADSHETHALLEFLGLDTLCDVYLNGQKILVADNQFQTHVVPLELSSLKPQNILFLHFKSALHLAKKLEAEMGKVRAGSTNLGDPSRVYVRKAQYDWRWDWGPQLMTCGPYRPITLKTYSARLQEVQTHALLSDENAPSLKVDVTLEPAPLDASLRVVLSDASNKTVLKSEDMPVSGSSLASAVAWDLKGVVEPWWPVGYGEQNLYTVSVLLLSANGQTLDESTTRVGFRRVALVQEPLEEPDQYGTGTSFLFEVNGVRIFAGGSNWVPADNFLTTIAPERFRAWLTLLRDGNQNMVRLWGGGVYEPDVFYDVCDELGILVWQDFQFACGVYPAHDSFVASVRKEAEDNVRRLRHHPSIALFCGNNEDYQMVNQWGDVPSLPAVKLYEEVFPEVVAALTGPQPIPYHRGSPYGGKGWDTADPTVGDVHQWNIWGGKEFPYHDYVKLGGRFVSEFGIPSHPEMKTIEYWMDGAGAEQRHAQSALMAQHCRAGTFERRFAILMNDNLRVTEDLETYVYNTRLMASEGVGYAYQVWRRKWGGPGKQYTGGVLVWQLNDCWPVTSWAIADYFLRPKPIYFTIARQLATYSVGVLRTVIKNRSNDRPAQYYEYGNFQSYGATLEIWGTNASLAARSATLELHYVDLKSTWTHTETHAVTLHPNQATELLSIPCPGPPRDAAAPSPTADEQFTTTHTVVAGARLLDAESGAVLARFADWPQPFRFVEPVLLRDPKLRVEVDGATGKVTVSAERPVKGLWLSALGDGADVKWSDNALDVMPGDPQVVVAQGLNGRGVGVAFLGKEKTHKP